MSEREWRDIPGETQYEVSNDGLIRRKALVLKPWAMREGHLQVTLSGRKRVLVHRAVAMAFMPNPESKRCVNHKNGKPADNRLENLEWATHGENNLHAYRSNGKVHYNLYSVISIDKEGEITHYFETVKDAMVHFGVTRSAIHNAIRSGTTCRKLYWKRA